MIQTIDLEDNEAAVSVATVSFSSQDNEVFLVVGTGKDMVASHGHRQLDLSTYTVSTTTEKR